MMRKLSVASIASNFTKRSGSLASLHKTTEDDDAGKCDCQRYDQLFSEPSPTLEKDDPMMRSRLSIIQDEKENIQRKESCDGLVMMMSGSNGSPASTLRRLATLKVKSSWAHDGQRIITPPLSTSSANSVNQSRVTLLSTVTDLAVDEKESISSAQYVRTPHSIHKTGKRSKVIGKGREVVVEGIRSLFR